MRKSLATVLFLAGFMTFIPIGVVIYVDGINGLIIDRAIPLAAAGISMIATATLLRYGRTSKHGETGK